VKKAPLLAVALLVSLSLTSGCKKKEPEPTAWDKPKASAEPAHPAVTASGAPAHAPTTSGVPASKAVDGAAFAAFFPDKGMDETTDKIVRPSKGAMAEVVYKKGKDEVITLVISDTATTPAVRDDYKDATEKVGAYPLKTSGYFKSAILVANRFQVAATSQKLKPDARKKWLEKVDLAGLAKVN
jgi:hypothetical protein